MWKLLMLVSFHLDMLFYLKILAVKDYIGSYYHGLQLVKIDLSMVEWLITSVISLLLTYYTTRLMGQWLLTMCGAYS